MPRVSVVVVTYNARPYLPDLLGSLDRQTFRDLELIFVDNASSDGTADHLPGRVIRMERNTGFAAGCNAGARAARSPLIFFLNQDTAADPNCVEELVRAMDARPEAVIGGAKMLFWHEPAILNSFGYGSTRLLWCWDRGIFEFDRGQHDAAPSPLGVCGGAMIVRRDAFERLGGFDTGFFMYQEDVDFGHRAAVAGHPVAMAPRARVYHKKDYGLHPRMLVHYQDPRNRLRSLVKNLSLPVLIWVALAHLLIEGCYMAWLTVRRRRPHLALLRAAAVFWNVLNLPRTWTEHERVARLRRVSDVRLLGLGGRLWLPDLPVRPPDHRSVWPEGAERVDLGSKKPEGLGSGWSRRITHGGRWARRAARYGLAYLGPGTGVELAVASRRPATARVSVNGEFAGTVSAGPAWQTVRLPLPPGAARNRLHLEIAGEPLIVSGIAVVRAEVPCPEVSPEARGSVPALRPLA